MEQCNGYSDKLIPRPVLTLRDFFFFYCCCLFEVHSHLMTLNSPTWFISLYSLILQFATFLFYLWGSALLLSWNEINYVPNREAAWESRKTCLDWKLGKGVTVCNWKTLPWKWQNNTRNRDKSLKHEYCTCWLTLTHFNSQSKKTNAAQRKTLRCNDFYGNQH